MNRVHEPVCHLNEIEHESVGRAVPGRHYHVVVKDESKLLVSLISYFVTKLLNTRNSGDGDKHELELLKANVTQAIERCGSFRLECLFHKLTDDGSQYAEAIEPDAHWSLTLYLPIYKGAHTFVEDRLDKVVTFYSDECHRDAEETIVKWLRNGIEPNMLMNLTERRQRPMRVMLPESLYDVVFNTRIAEDNNVKVIRNRCENYIRKYFVFDRFAACRDFTDKCVPESESSVSFLRMMFYSNPQWDRLMLETNLPVFIRVNNVSDLDEALARPVAGSAICRQFFSFQRKRDEMMARCMDTLCETVELMKSHLRYVGCDELKRVITDFLTYANDDEVFPMLTDQDMEQFVRANMEIRTDLSENLHIDKLLPKLLLMRISCECDRAKMNWIPVPSDCDTFPKTLGKKHESCRSAGRRYTMREGKPASVRSILYKWKTSADRSKQVAAARKSNASVVAIKYYDAYDALHKHFFLDKSVMIRDFSAFGSYITVYAAAVFGATDTMPKVPSSNAESSPSPSPSTSDHNEPLIRRVFSPNQATPVAMLRCKQKGAYKKDVHLLLLYIEGMPTCMYSELFPSAETEIQFTRLCCDNGNRAKRLAFPASSDRVIDTKMTAVNTVVDKLLVVAKEIVAINRLMVDFFARVDMRGNHYFNSVDEHVSWHFDVYNVIADIDLSLDGADASKVDFLKCLTLVNAHAIHIQWIISIITGCAAAMCPFYVYKSTCEKPVVTSRNRWSDDYCDDAYENFEGWGDAHEYDFVCNIASAAVTTNNTMSTINSIGTYNEDETECDNFDAMANIASIAPVDNTGHSSHVTAHNDIKCAVKFDDEDDVTNVCAGDDEDDFEMSDEELLLIAEKEEASKSLRDSCICKNKRGFRIVVKLPPLFAIRNPGVISVILNYAEMKTTMDPAMTGLINACGGKSRVFDRNIYRNLHSHRLVMTGKDSHGDKRLLPLVVPGSGDTSLSGVEFLKDMCTPRFMHMPSSVDQQVKWVISQVKNPMGIFSKSIPHLARSGGSHPRGGSVGRDEELDLIREMHGLILGEQDTSHTSEYHQQQQDNKKKDDMEWDYRVIVHLEQFLTDNILPASHLVTTEDNHSCGFDDAYVEYKKTSVVTKSIYFRLRHGNSYSYNWPCICSNHAHSSVKMGCNYVFRCRANVASGSLSIFINKFCFSTKCNSNRGKCVQHITYTCSTA